jgi:hypothetical protein
MRSAVDGGVRSGAAHPPNKMQASAESVTNAAVRRLLGFFTWAPKKDEISADLTALDDLNQKHNYGKNQEDVNESTERVGTDKSERPEDKKNDGDCVEHGVWCVDGLGYGD